MTDSIQPDLFTTFVDVSKPTFGGYRRTDPATSVNAAQDKNSTIRWGTQRCELLTVFATTDKFALSDEAAGRYIGMDHVAATRRLSELRRLGLIEPTEFIGQTSTGANCMTCRITRAGVAAHRHALVMRKR